MLFGYLYTLDDKDSFNYSDSDMSYDYFNNNTSTNQYLSSSYSQSDDIIDSVEHTVINNTSEYTLQHQYRSSISEEVNSESSDNLLSDVNNMNRITTAQATYNNSSYARLAMQSSNNNNATELNQAIIEQYFQNPRAGMLR